MEEDINEHHGRAVAGFSVIELLQFGGTAVLSVFFLTRFLRYCPTTRPETGLEGG
jgi:hypothetical protein